MAQQCRNWKGKVHAGMNILREPRYGTVLISLHFLEKERFKTNRIDMQAGMHMPKRMQTIAIKPLML